MEPLITLRYVGLMADYSGQEWDTLRSLCATLSLVPRLGQGMALCLLKDAAMEEGATFWR